MSYHYRGGHLTERRFLTLPALTIGDHQIDKVELGPTSLPSGEEDSTASLTNIDAARLVEGDLVTGTIDLSHELTHMIKDPELEEERAPLVSLVLQIGDILFLYLFLCQASMVD